MKQKLQLILAILFFTYTLPAQLLDGSIAPDWTAKDIDGVEHNLYDLLADGKSVILDFSATWCGPCWSYSQAGHLHDYMETYGPEGTDEAMVFFIEADARTTIEDLRGETAGTVGDWITGSNHPIIDNAAIGNMFQINSYPTVMMVCPDRKVTTLGQASSASIYQSSSNCPVVSGAPEVSFRADYYHECGQAEVNFYDDSWPRAENYLWDFGDGNTSTERSPTHIYQEPGSYDAKLVASNSEGENEFSKGSVAFVEEGKEYDNHTVGPLSKDIGSGEYFPGGHQGLIFDALQFMVISSVKVFSDRDGDRTIVLNNADGDLITSKTVFIPEGEHRIELDFIVPLGSNYRLGMHSDAFLFRNNSGPSYPYLIDGLVNIKESTASTAPLSYYYYFYDWEVRQFGCSDASNTDDFNIESIKLYPNPANEQLTVEGEKLQSKSIVVTNGVGQKLSMIMFKSTNQVNIDVSALTKGMYYILIDNQAYKFYKE